VLAPTATGLLAVGSAVCDTDFTLEGRTLTSLGLNEMAQSDLQDLFRDGF
jgi:opine dehydrogenase